MNLRQKLEMAENNDTVTLRCNDPGEQNCSYVWNYKGDMARATCPSCGYKINVQECRIDKEVSNED